MKLIPYIEQRSTNEPQVIAVDTSKQYHNTAKSMLLPTGFTHKYCSRRRHELEADVPVQKTSQRCKYANLEQHVPSKAVNHWQQLATVLANRACKDHEQVVARFKQRQEDLQRSTKRVPADAGRNS